MMSEIGRRSFLSGALASAVAVPAIADILPRTVVVSDQIFIWDACDWDACDGDITSYLRKLHGMRDCDTLVIQYCYFTDREPSESDVRSWREMVVRMKRGEEEDYVEYRKAHNGKPSFER